MPNTLKVLIGTGLAGSFSATDYGEASGLLRNLTVSPAGPGQVGTASITLAETAGTIAIKPRYQVYIGEFDGANYVKRYFGGFVQTVQSTGQRTATGTYRTVTLQCQDMNILADWLRIQASPPGVSMGGHGAAATATIALGAVNTVSMTSNGYGYAPTPTITITGDGTGAVAYARIVAGVVTEIFINATGSGYTTATASISGGTYTTTAVLGAVTLSAGHVSSIAITNGGTGYTSPTATFTGGAGSGALALLRVTQGQIIDIVKTAGGTGYTSAPTVVITDNGSYDFLTEMRYIAAVATTNNYNGSIPFDIDTGAALTGTLTGTRAGFAYTAMTLRDCFNDRMVAYQATFTSTRPRWAFLMDQTSNAVLDSRSVQFHTWDEALIGSASVAHTLSTATAGDIRSWSRNIDGAELTTRVQAMSSNTGSGNFVATYLSTNNTTYPNDFDQRPIGTAGAIVKTWEGPVRKMPDGQATQLVTDLANKVGKAKENPRDTITIVTDKADGTIFRPGQVVTVTIAAESLTAQRYRLQQVSTTWEARAGGFVPVHTLTMGNKWRELGGTDEEATSPVPFPTGNPDPPTNLTYTNVYSQQEGFAIVTPTWVSSVGATVAGYIIYWVNGTHHWTQYVADRTTTTTHAFLRPGLSSSFYITATDGRGLESDPATPPGMPFTSANGTFTDVSLFALQESSGAPYQGYDGSGNLRWKRFWNASGYNELQAVNTGSTPAGWKIRDSTAAGFLFIDPNGGSPTVNIQASDGAGGAGPNTLWGTASIAHSTGASTKPHLFYGGSVVAHKDGALGTTATDGFLYVPTCAGIPTGTPTTHTGNCALVYDTTNNNLYVYNGAWKKVGLA